MTCEYCEIIEGKGKAEVLYQDDDLLIVIKGLAVAPGQITIFTKDHQPIIEMVPDEIIKKCSVMAKKVSIAVFEGLGSLGTNVLVQNGLGAGQKVPHFAIEIVPRRENDGLNLQWEGKQLEEVDLETTFEALSKVADEPVKIGGSESSDGSEEKVIDDKDNYLLKSIKRLP